MPWLQRMTFGVNSGVLAQYRKLGREGYLAEQLRPEDGRLPDAVAREIGQLRISQTDGTQLLVKVVAEQKRINSAA